MIGQTVGVSFALCHTITILCSKKRIQYIKMDAPFPLKLIQTIRGAGYKISDRWSE
jgi:hypothetical protein